MTVEAALAMLALTVVLAGVVWSLGVLGAQLALGEAARAAARAAARGETRAEVASEAARLVPDVRVEVVDDGGHVVVDVRRWLEPPGLLARWGALELSATATAATEPAS